MFSILYPESQQSRSCRYSYPADRLWIKIRSYPLVIPNEVRNLKVMNHFSAL
jgi:hypothetical protein